MRSVVCLHIGGTISVPGEFVIRKWWQSFSYTVIKIKKPACWEQVFLLIIDRYLFRVSRRSSSLSRVEIIPSCIPMLMTVSNASSDL